MSDFKFEGNEIFHLPDNKLARIDTVWAYVSVDQHGEDICGLSIPNLGMTAMVFAHERMTGMVRPQMEALAKKTGRKIKLVKFTRREDLAEIG